MDHLEIQKKESGKFVVSGQVSVHRAMVGHTHCMYSEPYSGKVPVQIP